MFQQLLIEKIDAAKQILASRGQVFENSASFQTPQHQISIHTCFGPLQCGKTVNQDAALAVIFDDNSKIKWACALADGVSSSLLSEVGSRIATWTALATFIENRQWTSPQSRAMTAMHVAQSAICELATALKGDLIDLKYKPSYLPAPAYRHVVNRQTCFQTTLCLVWCDGKSIFLASVGDSGALQSTTAKTCINLFFPDLAKSHVNAICPTIDKVELDHWQSIAATNTFLAVFTDGVAKGLTEKHGNQLPPAFNLRQAFSQGQAEDCLNDLVASTSEEAADNMTLLMVSPS